MTRHPKRSCSTSSTAWATTNSPGLRLRCALTGHTGIPRESEIDFLAEADAAFAPLTQPKAAPARKEKKLTPIKAPAKKKKMTAKNKAA